MSKPYITETVIDNSIISNGSLMIDATITLSDNSKFVYQSHNEVAYIDGLHAIGGTLSTELLDALGVDYLDDITQALAVAAGEKWGSVENMLAANA